MSETRQQRITKLLNTAISPQYLSVENESHQHHVPKNSETHFKVIIVSDTFDEQRLVQRHRTINELLEDEFAMGLHALSIKPFTPKEWEIKQHTLQPSPNCKDGYGK